MKVKLKQTQTEIHKQFLRLLRDLLNKYALHEFSSEATHILLRQKERKVAAMRSTVMSVVVLVVVWQQCPIRRGSHRVTRGVWTRKERSVSPGVL